jgi:hypothetical protein
MPVKRGNWWVWLFGPAARPRRILTRRFEVADAVLTFLWSDEFSDEDRMAFADLVLKLDANPVKHSDRLATKPPRPGLRWAGFRDHKLVLVFDPSRNLIRVLAVEL